jgi:hypothetical protein
MRFTDSIFILWSPLSSSIFDHSLPIIAGVYSYVQA